MSERDEAMELSGELQESYLVNLLPVYLENRVAEGQAKRMKEQVAELLRRWFVDHPDEVLYDPERQIEASWRERRTPGREYDLLTLATADPVLFRRLLETGCLQVNHAAVQVQKAQVGGVERYAFPQGSTRALVVEVKLQ